MAGKIVWVLLYACRDYKKRLTKDQHCLFAETQELYTKMYQTFETRNLLISAWYKKIICINKSRLTSP